MSDYFASTSRSVRDPAVSIFEIAPDDATDLQHITTALNVASPGTVRVTTLEGDVSDVTIHPGHAMPLRVRRVWRTGTTATGIRGLT